MRKSFYTIGVFVKITTKRFFRDKLAIFFTIIFPLIFLFVFGGIFGKDRGTSFKIALINKSSSAFSKEYVDAAHKNDLFKIDDKLTSLDAAKEKMNRGELDAAVILPENFGVVANNTPSGQAEVYFTQNNETAGQTLVSIIGAQFKGTNAAITKAADPFTVVGKQTNDKELSRFDYTFAGLLGFSIIGLGIFGPINVFPELKKQGILRRLHTTPLRVWQYFVSTALSQAVVGLVTMVVLFAVAIAVFHLKVVGNVFELAIFIVLSITTILGIGLAVGGWAQNERQAAPLGNLIVFPMMFLSGTFFPRFLMPQWLQDASGYLPLTPVIDGLRLIATEGKHLTQVGPQIGLLAAWLVIVYLIAFRVFRWE
jgi:ABC-2 type transport system permease protein